MNIDSIDQVIDTAISKMGLAVARNFNRWPINGVWIWPNNFVGNSYQEDIDYLKSWIKSRGEWMDANIPGTCIVSDVNKELSAENSLRTYPNPAVGNINVEVQLTHADNVLVEVFNLYGQKVYSDQKARENYFVLKLSLAPGTYIVKVSSGDDVKTSKFVIY